MPLHVHPNIIHLDKIIIPHYAVVIGEKSGEWAILCVLPQNSSSPACFPPNLSVFIPHHLLKATSLWRPIVQFGALPSKSLAAGGSNLLVSWLVRVSRWNWLEPRERMGQSGLGWFKEGNGNITIDVESAFKVIESNRKSVWHSGTAGIRYSPLKSHFTVVPFC